jgi:signal transduction histidine kinase
MNFDRHPPIEGGAGTKPAGGRLEHLYAISKLFASFESIGQTFEPALGIVTETLPLRSAILIEADDDHTTMFAWPSAGQTSEELRSVKDQAGAAHRYLVGTESAATLQLSERAGTTLLPRQAETREDLRRRFIVIPLAVPRRPTFGTLALEGARTFDKGDLMFANAIANQLAIALDRDRAWQRDITRRRQAEQGKSQAEALSATAERELAIAERSRERSEALAADNALLYVQAQQAVRVREQILAIVSHDLRNPLATILMTTSVLAKPRATEERRKGMPVAIGRIQRSAERMRRLIEDLLDFASIETGRLAINQRAEDPRTMIDDTLAGFEGAAQEKRLELTAQTGPDLPDVFCDYDRILQVLSNLVGNAIKAVSEGGHITVRVEARERDLLFSVADDGPGISPEDLKHLFERYWRSDDVHYKGTGLGLAIARGLVAAHGGRIWAESEPGQGATFWFTVPGAVVARGVNDDPAIS